jgi:hypothetical protein
MNTEELAGIYLAIFLLNSNLYGNIAPPNTTTID